MKLLLGGDRVLSGLGHAELHNRLRLDLNGFTGLRVASDARLAVRLHQTSDAGNDEYAVLLSFLDRGVGQVLQKCCRRLVIKFRLLGQVADELGLSQACCHESSSFSFESWFVCGMRSLS